MKPRRWYSELLRAWCRNGEFGIEVVDTDMAIAARGEPSPHAVGRALGVAFCFRNPDLTAIG